MLTTRKRGSAGLLPALLLFLSASGTHGADFSIPQAGCNAHHYRIIELPLLPLALNESGQIAGRTPSRRAGLWSARTGLHELPTPAGFERAEAVAINRSGHLVVMAYDQTLSHHAAFLFTHGRLDPLPGNGVHAFGLNDADVVVGEAVVAAGGPSAPVVWDKGRLKPLGGCCGGTAKGINARGEVVGDIYDAQGRYGAFHGTAAAGIEPLGPVGNFSSAVAVNARATVLVQEFPENFLVSAGASEHLSLSPRFPSRARAFNGCEVVVGSFGPFSDAERAFIWDRSSGFQDLNSLITPGSGWKLEAATGINERGEIIGRGDLAGDDDTGFVLLPERSN